MKRRAYLLVILFAILTLSTLSMLPTGPTTVAGSISPTSWNPKVSCTPLIVRISDITANQTGTASFNSSRFTPGITTTVKNGLAKRWLTPGSTLPGWVSPGPACTVTNSKGTTSLFVQINGLERNTLVNEDHSTVYDPTNGATAHANTTDTTFNLFDPAVISNYTGSCTSPSDPTCYNRLHAEIDHDWKAAGYCGPGTVCDNATLASQSSASSTRIDVQGFVSWDPDNLNATWHDFSGWELHPFTAWRLSNTVNFSWSPTNPQVGGTTVFTASPSNGTTPSSFTWNFGDGVTATTTGNSVSHIFVTAQVFQVRVTMTDTQGGTASAQKAVPVGSWNTAVSCAPTLTTLEGIIGNVSIQRIPTNASSTGADYSGGGFKLDGNLPYGSNPTSWPFFDRDLQPPCSVNGTPAFVEFHNATVTDVSVGNCGTHYSIDNGGGSYPNGWRSCTTTFNLVTPGFGDTSTCPNCYMHRIYAGIDRDWNASGIAPLPAPVEGERVNVQGFVFWNNAFVNASWHSFSGWEIHPLSAWKPMRSSVTASATFSPSNPTTGQTVSFNGAASGGTGPYTFTWDFGDGMVATGNPANHAYPSGNYIVHIAAADSLGTIGVASLTATVRSVPPDFSISVNPGTLNLSAGSSGNTTVNVSSIGGFSGSVSLADLTPSGINASLTPMSVVVPSFGSATSTLTLSTSAAGNYTVTVTGTSASLSHSANLAVKVTDVSPTVSFTESVTTAPTGTTITLSISASDPDGTVTAIRVVWGDGTVHGLAGTATSDSHSYALAGSYTVYVNATDNANLTTKSSMATETITDRPPTVSFTESATTVATGTPITLTITSADPDGTVNSLKVVWGDGTIDSLTGSATNDSHAYSVAGTYQVYVNATDNSGSTTKSALATQTITDRPPTVSFTESATTVSTGTLITLTTTAADPDGTVSILKVSWGDGTVDTLAGSATSDSHSYGSTGNAPSATFTIYVNATDNSGSTTKSSTATNTVNDRPPTVSFTESASTVATATPITLSITAGDPDGTIASLKVVWGDGTIDSLAGSATSDTHSYALAGSYTPYVNATDNSNLTTKSSVAVKTITDRPPVVTFSESATTVPTGTTVTLSISTSDPDGTVASLKVFWGDSAVDSLAGTVTSDSHSYALAGSYTVYVNATDSANLTTKSAPATKTVTDRPPTVTFTESATTAPTGTSIALTITASDPDGTVTGLKVSWGDGTVDSLPGTATSDSHSYALAGQYNVYVNVTDNANLTTRSSTAVKTITDRPPTISFTESATTVSTGTGITLTITSSDPDGTVSSIRVSWGDGTIDSLGGSATADSHSYSVAGSYTVYVNATDNANLTSKSAVGVKAITDRPPTISFSESTTTAFTGSPITLTIFASDTDGTVASLKVVWGDGTIDSLAGSATSDSHAYSVAGTYQVYVNATDNSGSTTKSAAAVKTITDRPPAVSFTESATTVPTGTTITLTITSADPDGTVTTIKVVWGDGTVDSLAGTVTSDVHSYSLAGSYMVYVNATDNANLTTKSSAAIKTITDRPPAISFTESSTTVPTGTPVTLTTSALDPDGTVTSLKVVWGDGKIDALAGTATADSHTYASTGNALSATFSVYVNATDNSASTTKSSTVTETITDRAPNVSFTESTTTATTGQIVTLTITSADPDGSVSSLKVVWGDGTIDTLAGTATTDSHSYANTGNALSKTFNVYVNATDNSGSTTQSSISAVTVHDLPPTVSFTESATVVHTGTPVTLTITSADPDGSVSSLEVVWGDGTVDTLPGTATLDSHSYSTSGSFSVYVNATDNSGSITQSAIATNTIQGDISVSFTENTTTATTGQTITMTISASEPSGTIAGIKVVWGDGTVDSLPGTATSDSHAYSSTGNGPTATFQAYVNATDNLGRTQKSAVATNIISDRVPTVSFTESATSAPTGTSITLTVTSSDPDGTIASLKVVWGDGTIDTLAGTATSDIHAYTSTGSNQMTTFTVYVNATDNSGVTTKSALAMKTVIDRAPSVSFNESTTSAPTGTSITLTIAAADPDGSVSGLKVVWGDGTADSLAGTVTSDSYSYALAGSYTVYVNATDNANLTTKSAVAVKTITDRPPVVGFTESATTVPTGTSIALTISATDPDGTVSTIHVSWGDGTVDNLPGSAKSDSHSYSLAGSYSVYVNATDNANLTTQGIVALKTITDRPPTISFTESATTAPTGTPISLTISASDPDGAVTSIRVYWGDGTVDSLPGTSTSDSHSYAVAGPYTVHVNATDNANLTTKSSPATMTITDRPPTVSFTESATTAPTGTPITLTTISSDPDGIATSIQVVWGDGTIDNLPGTATGDSHAYSHGGTYQVYVNATDNANLTTKSAVATKTITDRSPIVSFTESATTIPTGTSITLTITSSDPDGTVNNLKVYWGDGTVDNFPGTVTSDNHAYSLAGYYTVYVNATDDAGQTTRSAIATKTVTDRPPVISFTESTTTAPTGASITLTISASDPDGTVSALKVIWGDGTIDSLPGTATGDSHSYALAGLYTTYVNATDNANLTTMSPTATKTITDRPSTVSFTESATTAPTGTPITLTITAGDPDGTVGSLKVVWGDGTIDSLAGPATSDSHSYALAGSYNVYINATDNANLTTKSAIAIKTITDRPPTVSFTESASTVSTATPITLSISTSDPDGTVSTIHVSWGDGTVDSLPGSATNDSHSYSVAGSYGVYVNATDNSNLTTQSAVALKTITDRPPTVIFTESATTALTGTPITLTISVSDPDGTMASLKVAWGDGMVDTLAGTSTSDSHAYTSTGNAPSATFIVYVNATDNSGSTTKSSTATKTINNVPPTVGFTDSATTAPTGAPISLTINAVDPYATVTGIKVAWGDGTIDSLAGTANLDTHSYSLAGSYNVYANATNNANLTAQSAVVTNTITDRPPTVSFTESASTVPTGTPIALTISTSDPDGAVSSIKVFWGDGTSDSLSGSATGDSHSYSLAGSYSVYVNATDNANLTTRSAPTANTIADRPPVVSFTTSATTVPTGTTITLTISASDLDGTVNAIKVVWGDGIVGSFPGFPSHSYAIAGSYKIYVNATDNTNLTTKSIATTETITDRPPNVSFTESATTVPTGTSITLTITSSDPDGTLAGLKVVWGDGTIDSLTGTATSTSHWYPLAGTFAVYVRATDNAGLTTQSSVSTNTIMDRPPAAVIHKSTDNALTSDSIGFDASASSDPDGGITGYAWNFGDGSIASGVTESHSYTDPGTYTVTLTVTDNNGNTNTISTTMTIGAAAPVPFMATPDALLLLMLLLLTAAFLLLAVLWRRRRSESTNPPAQTRAY